MFSEAGGTQEGACECAHLLGGSEGSLARGSALPTSPETRRTSRGMRNRETRQIPESKQRGEEGGGLGCGETLEWLLRVGEESNILSCIFSCQAFTLPCPQSSFVKVTCGLRVTQSEASSQCAQMLSPA